MQASRVCTAILLALIFSGGAVLAGHGRAGLWNSSTTMDIGGAMPPEMQAQMKAMGMPMVQTVSTQICMSQADVDTDRPPPMGDADAGCTTRLTNASAAAVSATMTCNGKMKGTGSMQIAYAGTDRYTGTFRFQGTMEGQPANMSGTFRGDWVRADCGAVRPSR